MMNLILIFILYLIRAYSLLLVIYALLSWFPGAYDSKFGQFVLRAVEPLIRPFRRFNLVLGGIDWTVWVVMIVLNLITDWIYRLF
ncbi:Cell division protein YlmG/Ycf19 (putative), YggT family [Streptococcus sp. DD10]|uniref:YggT family protein n=1 Tax=Streptococcus sp. DD10 TaxID=1777878 RepID=UPI00079854D2|nr:YggT family protein [Streptococcus sp. DD10]KXT73747.1 Cell division protein YlmG/Ycf19 (putative), YggT family [Streptococcus sp. DD10]